MASESVMVEISFWVTIGSVAVGIRSNCSLFGLSWRKTGRRGSSKAPTIGKTGGLKRGR
jgi:hypothetical protein